MRLEKLDSGAWTVFSHPSIAHSVDFLEKGKSEGRCSLPNPAYSLMLARTSFYLFVVATISTEGRDPPERPNRHAGTMN